MTARKPVQLGYEALHRIRLAARRWPANLEIYELGRHLSKAIYDYHSFTALRDIRAQKARLRAIHRHASALANLLRTDEKHGILDWYSQWPKELPPPSKMAEEIQRMADESGVLQTSPQKVMREIKGEIAVSGSAFEWLVGTKLPEVFELFFREKVTLSREGAYLDFASRVLSEFKIRNDGRPYSRETIMRALTRTRSALQWDPKRRRPDGGRK